MRDLERIRAALTAKLALYTNDWPAQAEPPIHLPLKLGRPVEYLMRALAKLKDGSYGTCDDCGQVIAKSRLEAVIGACRCLDCQNKHDQSSS